MSHTPGPWTYRVVDDGESAGIRVYAPKTATDIVHMPKVRVRGQYNTEKESNARLIAAAPELYEALRGLSGLLADVEDEPECDVEILRAIYAAREAIAKAERREST